MQDHHFGSVHLVVNLQLNRKWDLNVVTWGTAYYHGKWILNIPSCRSWGCEQILQIFTRNWISSPLPLLPPKVGPTENPLKRVQMNVNTIVYSHAHQSTSCPLTAKWLIYHPSIGSFTPSQSVKTSAAQEFSPTEPAWTPTKPKLYHTHPNIAISSTPLSQLPRVYRPI